ncbi:amino acid adenylation domain-containing protein [Rheinheimera baltica]|uniref:Amino acid adenylation domain-containing protein n=1 Tax=Rheinheimera baltica TaxID=67576 RepID=A0ABT9HUF6_9GAMM|nr:non-ribosomal peptide synthetase [Rheinheimera baltica]MDP5134768.1 amino acid adenylation domain-containing protein [Rheinheimera baltica]
MEDTLKLLKHLADLGVDVSLKDDNLKLRGLKGSLTEELGRAVRERKSDIVEYLKLSELQLTASQKVRVAKQSGTESKFPLGFPQQRLWFLEQLHGSGPAYTIPGVIDIGSSFDIPYAESAFRTIIARHRILRTVYKQAEGSHDAIQEVLDTFDFRLTKYDLSRVDAVDQHRKVTEYIARFSEDKFDISRDLVIRGSYVSLSDTTGILLYNIHHIAVDGWSMHLLEKEFLYIYDRLKSGEPIELEPPQIEYTDFAVYQRQWMDSADKQVQLKYWQEKLAGMPVVHNFPLDFNRPQKQSYQGESKAFDLSPELTEQISALLKRCNVTLFMFLHAAFSLLLARYSDNRDIIIGVPVANRQQRELEDVIGFFANTLVLRTDCDTDISFLSYLQQVKQTNLDAQANQDLPFEYLVEQLNPVRSAAHTPLFQIMMTLNNNEVAGGEYNFPEYSSRHLLPKVSKFDLTLHGFETVGNLSLVFEYNTSLFTRETVDRLSEHFIALLNNICRETELPMHRLGTFTEAERALLAPNINNKPDFTGGFVHTLLEDRAQLTPQSIAISFGEFRLTYAEFNERANKAADLFMRLGVSPGDYVGLCMERSIELMISLTAILKCRAAYVPLDVSLPIKRLQFILGNSTIRLLVTQQKQTEMQQHAKAEGTQVVCMDALETQVNLTQRSTKNPIFNDDSPDTGQLFVMYTSGSTGEPKGVVQTHRMMNNLVHAQALQFNVTAPLTTLQFAPVTFDASIHELATCWLTGGELVMLSEQQKMDLPSLHKILASQQIERIFIPPAVLNVVAESLQLDTGSLPFLREIFASGEALVLSESLAQFLTSHSDCRLFNYYGPTETHVVTGSQVVDYRAGAAPSIGRPLINVSCRVLDSNLREMPFGAIGELYVSGPCLADGYLNSPKLTEERFVKKPALMSELMYKTGDLVCWLPDGQLEFIGRADHQIKLRSFRIESREIEYYLCMHPKVKKALVRAMGEGESKRLFAYITVPQCDALDKDIEAQIRQVLAANLPYYMMPDKVIMIEQFPLNHNGKIDLDQLPNPFDGTLENDGRHKTVSENRLSELWSRLLKCDAKGINPQSSFFSLGGHSLLAARMVSHVRAEFNKDLTLSDVFENPTLQRITALIEARETKRVLPPVEKLTHTADWHPLSYAQARIWFIYSMDPSSTEYNLSSALRVSGIFRCDFAQAVLTDIIRKHAPLRSIYKKAIDGNGLQQFREDFEFLLRQQDVSQLPFDQKKAAIGELLQAEEGSPFDLYNDLPFRVLFLRTAEHEGILCYTAHHIVVDGWSLNILANEFVERYEALLASTSIPQEQLAITYADYVAWQRQWLNDSQLDKQLAHWLKYLDNIPTVHKLPLDHVRSHTHKKRGNYHQQILQHDIFRCLENVCQAQNVTLFMCLQAAFAAHLSRWSDELDIVMGAPIAGRTDQALESMIGLFLNTIVFRTKFEDNPNFLELLARTRVDHILASENGDMPFELLVERINPQRSTLHSPVFQIMINMNNTESSIMPFSGLDFTQMEEMHQVDNKYDITLYIQEITSGQGKTLNFNWVYDAGIFDEQTMVTMSGEFIHLLDRLLCMPHIAVLEHEWLNAASLPSIGNLTNSDKLDLVHRFESFACSAPQQIALEDGVNTLSYKELNICVNQTARYLAKVYSVSAGHRIAVAMERTVGRVVVILALFKLGAVYVPLSKEFPLDRLLMMVSDAEVKLTLTDKASLFWLRIETLPVSVLVVDGNQTIQRVRQEDDTNIPLPTLEANSPSHIIFTSGSTGRPKGVLGNRGALNGRIGWMLDRFKYSTDEVACHITSMAFIRGLWELMVPLCAGVKLSLCSRDLILDSGLMCETLYASGITRIVTSPSYLHTLVDALHKQGHMLERLKYWFVSGEALPLDYIRQAMKVCPNAQFFNLYGSTEVMSDVLYSQVDETDDRAYAPLGKPISGTCVAVLGRNNLAVPPGVVGEIVVTGESISLGYIGPLAATLNESKFALLGDSRSYRTGDYGLVSSNGNILYVGRKDDELKVRGYRVNLNEVEHYIRRCDTIHSVAVCPSSADPLNCKLVAYLVLGQDSSVEEKEVKLTVQQIRLEIARYLPDYMLPADYLIVKQLPLKANGKVDKHALSTSAALRVDNTYVAAATELEKAVVRVWEEVLGLKLVSVDANFFTIGGHSLAAMRIVDRLERDLELKISPILLFDNPTVAQFCQFLEVTS